MNKIAVIGSRGQLGGELCRRLGNRSLPLDKEEIDITRRDLVLNVLANLKPDAVLNTAAYTLVDKAEENPAICHAINADGVAHLAEACRRLDVPLLQISTDYVFGDDPERRTPYREDEPTSPQGVYAQSKRAGEVQAARWAKHFIVRTCGLNGQPGANTMQSSFVDTMLRLGRERGHLRVVDDQHCTPSYVPHVAAACLFLFTTTAYGTYHVVNGGATTWHDFAAEIFRQAGLNVTLERITTAEYGAKAPRPSYSVLDTAKYHALGGPAMPTWQAALAEYLAASNS